jgi:hypothetical protein
VLREEVVSIFDEGIEEDYQLWEATIGMKNLIFGGVPQNPETIEGWIRARAGLNDDKEVAELLKRNLQELGHDTPDTVDLDELRAATKELAGRLNTNGFKKDEHGLYIEGRQIMSMLRESVSVLYTGRKWGYRPAGKLDNGSKGKAATSYFRERVHVPDERIYLGRDEPDGIELNIVHPKDPKRESSLSYVEYVEHAELSFTVEELHGTVPGMKVWRSIWRHAERNGLGSMRSQQWGKFGVLRWEATVLNWEPIGG